MFDFPYLSDAIFHLEFHIDYNDDDKRGEHELMWDSTMRLAKVLNFADDFLLCLSFVWNNYICLQDFFWFWNKLKITHVEFEITSAI